MLVGLGRANQQFSPLSMETTDAIFLLGANDQLEKVPYSTYRSEDVLQELIARYPELMVGEQIDPDDPPRWLLVCREAGVPDAEVASDRWSLDHLLLDHRAVPTLVEVKRSSDTRIRREVIGQMLDYAANATRYWPTDRIRMLAAAQMGGVDQLDQRVAELLSAEDGQVADVEAYWRMVEENLRAGRLRMLFVADELPRELRRVIEFLNEHMPKIQVLGVEVRHYAGNGMRALVPRVVGQTERARDEKALSPPSRKTGESEFLAACPIGARDYFEELLREARAEGLTISWGTKGFSVRGVRPGGKAVSVLYGYPAGAVGSAVPFLEIFFKDTSPEDDPALLRSHLLALGGFREAGHHTVRLQLTEATLQQARDALPHVWEIYRRIGGGMA